MKTPLWESAPGALAALINAPLTDGTASFVYAHLYTITLFGSQGTIRLTDADVDIAYNGLSFSSKGPFIDIENSKALAHWKRGLDVDTWVATFLPRAVDPVTGAAYPDKIGSTPWIAAARAGALDGADVQVDRAYFAAWPQPYRAVATPTGVLTIFAGRPAEVDCTDALVVVTLNDYRELLLAKLPRNVFQAGCRHTLFDAGCAISANSFGRNCAVASVQTQSLLTLTSGAVTPAIPWSYLLGKIVMTSGLNVGFSRTITAWNPSLFQLALLNPLPFTVAPGDACTVFAGCDKQQTTCSGVFGNLANFGGESFVPDATTAI